MLRAFIALLAVGWLGIDHSSSDSSVLYPEEFSPWNHCFSSYSGPISPENRAAGLELLGEHAEAVKAAHNITDSLARCRILKKLGESCRLDVL